MENKYYPPSYESNSFHCPHCNVFANQHWGEVAHNIWSTIKYLGDFRVSYCTHCAKFSLWHNGMLKVPMVTSAPPPHTDMPESIINDFNEARNIANQSPRGAAALLRLVLQKLMVELGESGKDINKDIGSLVQKGLPEEVQQALDIVRVIGNESVHPGELRLEDDVETASQLFELINFIIEEQISRKKRISSLFSRLPEGKRKGIEERDKAATVQT